MDFLILKSGNDDYVMSVIGLRSSLITPFTVILVLNQNS